MPPVVKKSAAAPSQADAAAVKATAAASGKPAAGKAVPAKSAALAAVTAALAATAASAAPQKAAAVVSNQAVAGDDQKPKRWIVKKTLNKFKANLRSVPDYYLPKFIQLIAAEVAPRCDGDQQLSRYLKFAAAPLKEDSSASALVAKPRRRPDEAKSEKKVPSALQKVAASVAASGQVSIARS